MSNLLKYNSGFNKLFVNKFCKLTYNSFIYYKDQYFS